MDPLTSLLDDLRSSGSLVGRNLLAAPWAIRCEENASLTLVSMLRGDGQILSPGLDPISVHTHEVAVVTGPTPFTVTSDADTTDEPLYVLAAAGQCTDAFGAPLPDGEFRLGLRTCGTDLDAPYALLTGSFTATGRLTQRLLAVLPRVLVVPSYAQRAIPMDLLEEEIARDEPGQQAILDRLLDVALIATLRSWFSMPDTVVPPWFHAASDPIVGPALEAFHEDPAHGWTVQRLADAAGVSRAQFARRFTEVMAEAPMSYVTGWRLCLAADLLHDTNHTVDAIASRVGYGSGFALSAAFKREYRSSPRDYRRSTRM